MSSFIIVSAATHSRMITAPRIPGLLPQKKTGEHGRHHRAETLEQGHGAGGEHPQRRVLEQIAGHSAEEGQVKDAHPNRGGGRAQVNSLVKGQGAQQGHEG